MATVEYIQKRIEGKESEIEKLLKKIERIEKAASTDWKVNPYYYSESDLRYANKCLKDAETSLAKYRQDLEDAINKAASRNMPVITEFLDAWYDQAVDYYLHEFDRYTEAQQAYYARNRELTNSYNYGANDRESRAAISKEIRTEREKFRATWSHVTQFLHGDRDWEETMKADLKKERDRKYDDLVERICSVVGQIVDASNLRINPKGDIDGIIVGTEGKASIQTVGAGGYNQNIIVNEKHGQIFHYRTLIKKL